MIPAVWPAPMEGVMHPVLVAAVNRLKLVPVWMTPFFRVTSQRTPARRLREFIEPFLGGGVPVHVQLMGTDPAAMGAAAQEFMKLGAAGINLNFGCPSKQVMRHGSGGGRLRDVPSLLAVVRGVAGALSGAPLSIKLRSGFDRCDSTWYSELRGAGASSVFMHFRTVVEGYRELPFEVALERFSAEAAALDGVALIANGDIDSAERRDACCSAGCAGVMIGRPWFRDPGLLRRLTGPAGETGDRRCELFQTVVDLAKNDGEFRFFNGRAIELSVMLWGAGNPVLELLKNASDGAWRAIDVLKMMK